LCITNVLAVLAQATKDKGSSGGKLTMQMLRRRQNEVCAKATTWQLGAAC
jgi:hypothetical protein